ncbi:MAG TPA: peptidase T [Candidatus Galloscillospira excrementipullorum]|nr:peptidase T [Candidatus Galloscillospira excrementipullorum]
MQAYERLLSYVSYDTCSDASSPTCPSTEHQRTFGAVLVEEMLRMGIADAHMDENGYVTGTIPANTDKKLPVIGFIAHMDVVDEVPSAGVKPRLVKAYDGGDIVLNAEKNIVMSPDEFESLKAVVGHDLIVTDGTTLLGADDKAGIAEILTMAERLLAPGAFPHGVVKIGFTPDEEIGRGADLFPVEAFGADFAYTVDGDVFGGIDNENFNATALQVSVAGLSTHPGAAKNKMINACLVAMEFQSMLPVAQRPEYTEGREGFFHLTNMTGSAEKASLTYILRDHDRALLERRKELAKQAAVFLNHKYGPGTVTLDMRDTYYNMAEMLLPHPEILELAHEAIVSLGGTPVYIAARGGTDGSRLSFMGLPCPNLATGSRGSHGRFEYVSVNEMELCTKTLLQILRLAAERDWD